MPPLPRRRPLARARLSGRALGAAQLAGYLEGEVSLEAAVADSVTATRQFAKRQRTWFRNRMRGLAPDRPEQAR